MGWSKEVAEALATLERAYGSFVLVARAKDMTGVLVHAHSPTVGLVDDVARWLVAYRTAPPSNTAPGCWIDGCGKPTRPAGGICEGHERSLAADARRGERG